MSTPHRIFDFFNAYIGTKDFNYIYDSYNIQYSIMGHVHFRKTLTEVHGLFPEKYYLYAIVFDILDMGIDSVHFSPSKFF
jgi:hypothetical protein